MGPSNILYKTHSFAYALSNSLLRIYILYQLLLGQVVTNIYPIVPCPLPLAPLYLTLTHFEQEATGHHAKPREAEILCREGLAPSVG